VGAILADWSVVRMDVRRQLLPPRLIEATVARDLLNDLPDWALALIFVVGTVIVVLAGFALVRRLLPAWRNERSSQTIAGVAAMVMTIFALVLAFVISTTAMRVLLTMSRPRRRR
jgi:predicted permease